MEQMDETATRRLIIGLACAAALTAACADSTEAPEPEVEPDLQTNTVPVAIATGPDGAVSRGATVRLDGTGSYDPDGEALTYTWRQVEGPTVTLQGATSPRASFAAPQSNGLVIISLTVSDGEDTSLPAEVWVTMENQAPTAAAAPLEELLGKRQEVTLDASASVDPDGDPLFYTWRQVSGPTATLSGGGPTPTLTTPGESGEVVLEMVASDGLLSSAPVTVQTTIINAAPVADAGPNRQVFKGDWVVLESNSVDPDGDPLTYRWEQLEGPTVELSSDQTANALFYAPGESGDVMMALTVSDGESQSQTAQVQVRVRNRIPIADAGESRTVQLRTLTTLDGTASFDQDDDPLQYLWTQRSGPPVELDDPSSATPTWTTPSEPATLVFDLQVNDGEIWSDTDAVVITVGRTYAGARARFIDNPFRETLDTPGPVQRIVREGAAMLLADVYNGAYLVDLTDPTHPALLGAVPIDGLTTGIALDGVFRLYASRGADGIASFDLSDPGAPVLTTTLPTPGWAASVLHEGNLLYVADRSAGLVIIDESDPNQLEIVGALAVEGTARDVTLVGDVAYVPATYGGLSIVDVADPTAPALLAHIPTEDEALVARVEGDRLYLADSRRLRVFDCSDPAAPQERGAWEGGAAILGLSVQGTTLFAASSDQGLQIIDAADPDAPRRVDVYDTPGVAWDVTSVGDIAYVADNDRGLQIIHIADAGQNLPPSLVTEVTANPRAVASDAERAWVVTAEGIALLDPWTLDVVGGLNPMDVQQVALDVAQQRAWLVINDTELTALDTLDPLNPHVLGAWSAPGPIEALAVHGERVYAVTAEAGLHTLDASLPSAPVELGSAPISGEVRDLEVSETRAWVASSAGLLEFDVSRIGSPRQLSVTSGRMRAIARSGALMALVTDYQGVQLVSVANPLSPPARLPVELPIEQPVDALFDGTLLHVASARQEVQAWELADPTAPDWIGTWATSSTPARLTLLNRALLASLPGRGLQVLDLLTPGLGGDHDFVTPGETVTYTPAGAQPGYSLVCLVTGGACEVTPGLDGEPPSVRWSLPAEPGDYEIAVALGNYHTFRRIGTDEVFVRD